MSSWNHWTVYLEACAMPQPFRVGDMVRKTLGSEGALRPRLEGLVALGVLARIQKAPRGRLWYAVVEWHTPAVEMLIADMWPELNDDADAGFAVPKGHDKTDYKNLASSLNVLIQSGRIHRDANGRLTLYNPEEIDAWV